MSKIPESFYFYKEHLRRAKEEKVKLQREYQFKIEGLNEEITFLKEKIDAQHSMIAQSVEHALKLEQEIKSIKSDLDGENESLNSTNQ